MINNDIVFSVDDVTFKIDRSALDSDAFIVDSVPCPYQVTFLHESDTFESIEKLLSDKPKNLLFVDQKVFKLHADKAVIDKARVFEAEATEEFKSIQSVLNVVDFVQAHHFTKGEDFLVVGGGIIQDVGAFVGASYKRGIPWMLFPTTLLSMCDSCIGGKAGVNYGGAKNQLGLFSAPRQVFINTSFLKTLDPVDLRSGLGEVLKLLIIGGHELFALYESLVEGGEVNDFSAYEKLIKVSLFVKKAVIEYDEFELHHRKSLNYGHTLGHAIEILSDYRIPHGLAVVVGMILVNALSARHHFLSEETKDKVNQACLDLLPADVFEIIKGISIEKLADLLKKDKKTQGNNVNFVIIKDLGDIGILKLPLNDALVDEIHEIMVDVF